uniref:Uncharacterized protein n=1 Tax=Schistosoma curassoni TaxID=6186 RepID=A0A183JQM3_9TREM
MNIINGWIRVSSLERCWSPLHWCTLINRPIRLVKGCRKHGCTSHTMTW